MKAQESAMADPDFLETIDRLQVLYARAVEERNTLLRAAHDVLGEFGPHWLTYALLTPEDHLMPMQRAGVALHKAVEAIGRKKGE